MTQASHLIKLVLLTPILLLSWAKPLLANEIEARAQYLTTLTPHFTGPNCWNSSMIALGAVENFRFMDLEEFEFYLRKYCQRLEEDEALGFATLIVERELDRSDFIDEILHSFLHFSSQKAFGKDSREPIDRPHFDVFENTFVFASLEKLHTKIPPGFRGNIALPYSCDFSTKPDMPSDIKQIMDMFHKINIGELSLTEELYLSLEIKSEKLSRETHYARALIYSVKEQLRFFKKHLEKSH